MSENIKNSSNIEENESNTTAEIKNSIENSKNFIKPKNNGSINFSINKKFLMITLILLSILTICCFVIFLVFGVFMNRNLTSYEKDGFILYAPASYVEDGDLYQVHDYIVRNSNEDLSSNYIGGSMIENSTVTQKINLSQNQEECNEVLKLYKQNIESAETYTLKDEKANYKYVSGVSTCEITYSLYEGETYEGVYKQKVFVGEEKSFIVAFAYLPDTPNSEIDELNRAFNNTKPDFMKKTFWIF